ncbi:MAG TPA: pitrilysin family protein [Alcanivoracaceae bacterium]|nr:pitrilysin family protein [Alcanivoracaceae bacterium]
MSSQRSPLVFIALFIVALIGVLLLTKPAQTPNATFPTSLASIAEHTATPPKLDIKTWHTEAGSRVLFLNTAQIPMVEVRLTFNAGGARDGDYPGLAALTNAMLDQGSEGHSVDDIAVGFENLGAAFGLGSYRDMAVVSLTSLSEQALLDEAVALFSQILAQPTFPQDNLERLRTRSLQGLKMRLQTPGPQLERAFQAALFAEHPYGQPEAGTEASLTAIEPTHLHAFYQRYYTGANATIALVGDIDEATAKNIAQRISAALPVGDAAPALPEAAVQPAQTQHISFDSSQTHIALGNQMIKRGHPDYVPLYVGNHILGGSGFSAILMDEVRQKRGLVYGIYSNISPMAAAGPFTLKLQTANENKDEALALTLDLLKDFVRKGPSEEQLKLALSDLTGSFALSTASNNALVGQLSAIGFYDMPLDYLAQFQRDLSKVTAKQIKTVFAKHLDPNRLVITSIGPEAPMLLQEEAHEQK